MRSGVVYLLLLLTIFCGCDTAYAQLSFTGADRVFDGALVAGMNMSQVDGDSYNGYHKAGINAGGMVYVHFSKLFGMSMELLYTQKGSRNVSTEYSYAVGQYLSEYTMKLNYAEVPIMLHIYDGRFDYEAGMSYARLIKSSEELSLDYPVYLDPQLYRFNNYDLGYVIGISHKLYKHLYANARFQYSALPIRPTDRVPVGYAYGSKGQFNNLIAIRLLYWL